MKTHTRWDINDCVAIVQQSAIIGGATQAAIREGAMRNLDLNIARHAVLRFAVLEAQQHVEQMRSAIEERTHLRNAPKEGNFTSGEENRGSEEPLDMLIFNVGVEPKIGVTPPKWLVKILENPMNKWMIWGFSHIFGNAHMVSSQSGQFVC